VSPEAAAAGELSVIKDGDIIEIDIPGRKLNVKLSEDEMNNRMKQEELKGYEAFKPGNRNRDIPASLRAYAAFISSADKGAVRLV
jgi:dihydroxy-acid dehydratase